MYWTIKVCIILVTIYSVRAQSYSAGVVVYRRHVGDPLTTPDEKFNKNIEKYVELIKQNKNKVDILVFPEYGLTDIRSRDAHKPYLFPVSSKIGNVNNEICNKTIIGERIVKLACAAKDNDIYVIANLIEKTDDDKYYLTTVGFDPSGSLCLKCRKSHLRNESSFGNNSDEKSCTFKAKFKNHGEVPFTVLFGNDIVYPIPAAIKTENVIMTSAINNTLPLNVGFSLYQAFAISNGINLLVSGYYETNTETDGYNNYGGSGIYYANGSSIVRFKPEAQQSQFAAGTVLQADIPIKSSSVSPVQVKSRLEGDITTMSLQYMNISGLKDKNKIVNSCVDSKNCCNFTAELTDNTIEPYKWILLSNRTTILYQEVDIFLCALVAPSELASKSVKNITISSTIDESRTFLRLPLALGPNILPIDFIYIADTNQIILSKEGNVSIFGLLYIFNTADKNQTIFTKEENVTKFEHSYVLNTASVVAGSNLALIIIITLLI